MHHPLVGVIFTDAHCGVPIMISSTPQGLPSQPSLGHWQPWLDLRRDQWAWAQVGQSYGYLLLLLVSGWTQLLNSGLTGGVLFPLLPLASSVPASALLPCWSLGALLGEWSCFLYLGLMVHTKNGNPTGVLVAGMSDMGRAGGGRVLVQHAGLLMDAGAWETMKSGVVLPAGASFPGCMTAVSVLLTEHNGTAPELAAVKRNHRRSLTKLAWYIWERTSLNVVSPCSAILACWSSCFWAILAHRSSCFLAILAH